ncbi:MAG: hypothetical protein V4621_05670 [Pseudomonadota bacterium]
MTLSHRALSLFVAGSFVLPAPANAESGGLPQFDPTWYASQVFWLVITFAIMFVVFAGLILPRISATMTARRQKLESDLQQAEAMAQQAATAQDAAQKSAQQAQNEAIAIIAAAGKEIEATTAQRYQSFRDKAEADILALQRTIDKTAKKAQSDMTQDVAGLVVDVLGKTAGIKLAANDVQTLLQEKPEAA